MKKTKVTTEWLAAWAPRRREEIADALCKGLVIRGGPSGEKVFYRWASEQGEGGRVRRKRVRLGRWTIEGDSGGLSLGAARELFLDEKAERRAEVDGTATRTVGALAESYRADILSQRETAAEAWNVVRVHVVEARPDPARPPFGEWTAGNVKPADVAAVVRYAKEPRLIEKRQIGGAGVARVVLRELKAIFAHAVETGALEFTPAGVMRSRSFGLRAVSRNRVLDADELKAFFEALDLTALLDGTAKPKRLSPTIRLALAFQLYVPLRSQSLIGARWEELDIEAARWVVPVDRLKMRKEERATARPFVVPLPSTAVAILRRLRELAGASPWVLASPLPQKPDAPPAHVEDKALIRALSRLQSTGRLSFGAGLTVHDLRRTWRSLAMDLGVDHVVAERSLGHVAALRSAGFSGAADVYGRAQLVEQRAAAAELVGAALDRIRLGEAAKVVPLHERRPA